MTTTTERRAVEIGDRFMCVVPGDESGALTVVRREDARCWDVLWDSSITGLVYDHDLHHARMFKRIDVPAAAPLAVDRTGPPDNYHQCQFGRIGCERFTHEGMAMCWECWDADPKNSPLYDDARRPKYTDWTPPIAAQPAETVMVHDSRCCLDADHKGLCKWAGMNAQPAPQPAPAKPVCVGSLHACEGPVIQRVVGAIRGPMCESWMFRLESIMTRATPASGTPYTGPERLERPKLAHVAGMHDDDLIGGAR